MSKTRKFHVQVSSDFYRENVIGWSTMMPKAKNIVREKIIKELQEFLSNNNVRDCVVLSGFRFDKVEKCLIPEMIITNLDTNTSEMYQYNIKKDLPEPKKADSNE